MVKYVEKKGERYVPSKEGRKASLAPLDIYARSVEGRVKFWEGMSKEISWIKDWNTSYKNEKGVHFSWFKDGKLNLCYNAVDRHMDKPDKSAIVFVPENPKEKKTSDKLLSTLWNGESCSTSVETNGCEER